MSAFSRRALFTEGMRELLRQAGRCAVAALPTPIAAATAPGAAVRAARLRAPERELLDARLARILPSACLAFRGDACTTCVTACPIDAIHVTAGRPSVDPARCDGCGLCIPACPAPRGAIIQIAAGPAPTPPPRRLR